MFPLREAYAITTHRSQGMTLSSISVNFRNMRGGGINGFFAHQPYYVALFSRRVKNLKGLRVRNLPATFAEFNRRFGVRHNLDVQRELLRLQKMHDMTTKKAFQHTSETSQSSPSIIIVFLLLLHYLHLLFFIIYILIYDDRL